MRRKGLRSKKGIEEFPEYILRKLVWFLFVPLISFLTYYTSVRPYFASNFGAYFSGFLDGFLLAFSAIIVVIALIAKLKR
jgi:polyferredoxin